MKRTKRMTEKKNVVWSLYERSTVPLSGYYLKQRCLIKWYFSGVYICTNSTKRNLIKRGVLSCKILLRIRRNIIWCRYQNSQIMDVLWFFACFKMSFFLLEAPYLIMYHRWISIDWDYLPFHFLFCPGLCDEWKNFILWNLVFLHLVQGAL